MAPPTQDEDVVVPLQLQSVVDRPSGLRGRAGGVVAFALIGFLVVSVVLGRVLDAGPASRPPPAIAAGSPAASAPPTPRTAVSLEPTASPLPSVEVVGGRIPTERRFVYADGLQVLDLATGTLQPASQPLYDQYLPIGPGEVVCACSLNGIYGGDPAIPPSIRFGRYDTTGTVVLQREVLRYEDVVPVPDMTNGVGAVSALSPDRATLYTVVAARRPPSWTIDLYAIDVESGKIVEHASLGRIPVAVKTAAVSASPSPAESSPPAPPGEPPDGIYAWPNWLAVAPDGQTLFAVVSYQEVRNSVWSSHTREWMVPVHDRPGTPIRIKSGDSPKPDDWCLDSPAFVDPKLVVQTCATPNPASSGAAFYVRRLTTGGQSRGNLPIDGAPLSQGYPISTLLDPPSRSIILWDPVGHVIGRISVDDGSVQTTTVPESMLPAGPGTRDMGPGASPALVQSTDGTRLYALGLMPAGGGGPSSSGIWVFDSESLALIQHWPARALLTSLAVSADGTFVYAAGAQGFDVDGLQRPWPASVTVYDAETGEIQVVYGAVSSTSWVNFFPVWP